MTRAKNEFPKTKIVLFYRNGKNEIIECPDDKASDLIQFAKIVERSFLDGKNKIENLELIPDTSGASDYLPHLPFVALNFTIHIKNILTKKRITLVGKISLFLSDIQIKLKGEKIFLKKGETPCSSTVIEDVSDLLVRGINQKIKQFLKKNS